MPELIENKAIAVKEPEKPWTEREYKRAKWIKAKVRFGEHIKPPNEQSSNTNLSDREVMQPRNENITQGSAATPLRKSNMESDEPSGRKQI